MAANKSLELVRKDLSQGLFVQAGERLTSLSKQGWSSATLSHELDISDAMVRHHVRIADRLHDEVKLMCEAGQLKFGHARVVASFVIEDQLELAQRAVSQHLSVRQLESLRKHGELKDTDPDANYYHNLAQDLSEQLGHPLSITPTRTHPGSGFIRIQYFDTDDFDTVCKKIGLRLEQDEF